MARLRVALFFGGVSSEHEISCLTAGSVVRALDRDRFDVVGVGITKDGTWVRVGTDELTGYQVEGGRLPSLQPGHPRAIVVPADPGAAVATLDGDRLSDVVPFDVAFALLHGPFGEDGTIQGLFEMNGVRYVGAGVAASAIGMDKDLMKRAMAAAGLPVGPWVTITPARWRDDPDGALAEVSRLAYPLFVKPARGGSSLGIVKVTSPAGLRPAIESARAFDPKVIVEQGFTGVREIEVAVIEDLDGPPRTSLPGEVLMRDPDAYYDFDAKYLPEEEVELAVPAHLDPQTLAAVRDLAGRTFSAMAVEGLARVDLFVDADGKPWVNELNTMPGFTALSMFPMMWAATGIEYSELISILIDLAAARPLGLR